MNGASQLEVFIWHTPEQWFLSPTWPPEIDYYGDDCGGEGGAARGEWVGKEFCAPGLAREELSAAGYTVDIRPVSLRGGLPTSDDENSLEHVAIARMDDAYRMTIRWESEGT